MLNFKLSNFLLHMEPLEMLWLCYIIFNSFQKTMALEKCILLVSLDMTFQNSICRIFFNYLLLFNRDVPSNVFIFMRAPRLNSNFSLNLQFSEITNSWGDLIKSLITMRIRNYPPSDTQVTLQIQISYFVEREINITVY